MKKPPSSKATKTTKDLLKQILKNQIVILAQIGLGEENRDGPSLYFVILETQALLAPTKKKSNKL